MIQPVAKLRFVERYCSPVDGWSVFVDIDPSEEGRTGAARQSDEAIARQDRMRLDAPAAVQALGRLGACVGRRRKQWKACFGNSVPLPKGDRDIIAIHRDRKLLWITEVEGDSSGQPEGKIYRAIGQLVCAVSEVDVPGFERFLSIAVWGGRAASHLARARAVERLGISGLVIGETSDQDDWMFGVTPPNIPLQRPGGSPRSPSGR